MAKNTRTIHASAVTPPSKAKWEIPARIVINQVAGVVTDITIIPNAGDAGYFGISAYQVTDRDVLPHENGEHLHHLLWDSVGDFLADGDERIGWEG